MMRDFSNDFQLMLADLRSDKNEEPINNLFSYSSVILNESSAIVTDSGSSPDGFASTLPAPVSGNLANLLLPPYLHVKWHAKCYLLYAEYYFEAWATKDLDPNSERVNMDRISIAWRHGSTKGNVEAVQYSTVSKDDRTYNLGCDSEVGIAARANIGGRAWLVVNPPGFIA